jgi:filamentous hemagglutinin
MPHTNGFAPGKLAGHAGKHRAEFGVATDAEYEQLADEFLGGPIPCGVVQAVRCGNGDCVRYDPNGGSFGVLRNNGEIKTFYKPDPAVHGAGSNADYFCAECLK